MKYFLSNRFLLASGGLFLVLDALFLLTVKVSNFGMIVPLVIGVTMLALAFYWLQWHSFSNKKPWRRLAWKAVCVSFVLWLISLGYFFYQIQAYKTQNLDGFAPTTILVLGSSTPREKPSPTLAARLDKAYDLSIRYPKAMLVVSGGVDSTEVVSEAKVMSDYLVQKGIDERRIWQEGKSSSTYENFVFTSQLLEQKNLRVEDPILIVSSDFHLIRAEKIAANAHFSNVKSIGSNTPLYVRYNAWLREYFAFISGWFFAEY